jgi:hypothetical protein
MEGVSVADCVKLAARSKPSKSRMIVDADFHMSTTQFRGQLTSVRTCIKRASTYEIPTLVDICSWGLPYGPNRFAGILQFVIRQTMLTIQAILQFL